MITLLCNCLPTDTIFKPATPEGWLCILAFLTSIYLILSAIVSVTVYVDGEQVDLAEVEIEENTELVGEIVAPGNPGSEGETVEVHTVEHEGIKVIS